MSHEADFQSEPNAIDGNSRRVFHPENLASTGLVLSRYAGQEIVIDEKIVLHVRHIGLDRVRIFFRAVSRDIPIRRAELPPMVSLPRPPAPATTA